jgi:hypothetical protein
MSVHKPGASSSGIQENFDDIQGEMALNRNFNLLSGYSILNIVLLDLLIKVKAKLNDDHVGSGSLADELYQVAALAENFTAQRPRSNKNWSQLADTLDREGMSL